MANSVDQAANGSQEKKSHTKEAQSSKGLELQGKLHEVLEQMQKKKGSLFGISMEIFLLNSIVLLLYYTVPRLQYAFLTMNIHPLLVITCIVSLRHGFIVSIFAALTSSFVYILAYLHQGLDPVLFFQTFSYYKFPIMFFIGGYLLGRTHDKNRRTMMQLKDINDELLTSYNELEEDHRRSLFIIDELKEQIVGAEYSIFSLYEIASSLQTTNPEKVYTESVGLLYKFIKAKTVSVYTLAQGSYLRLKLLYGNPSVRRSSLSYKDNPGYKRVIEQKEVVKWNPNLDDSFPIFSAPITADGEVIGVINIDEMDFDNITEYSYSVFRVITEWINSALSQALSVDKQFSVLGVSYSNVLDIHQMKEQLKEEQERKEKYELPFIFQGYSLARVSNIEAVIQVFLDALRSVDYICHDRKRNILFILLPATPVEYQQSIENRIYKKLSAPLEKVSLSV